MGRTPNEIKTINPKRVCVDNQTGIKNYPLKEDEKICCYSCGKTINIDFWFCDNHNCYKIFCLDCIKDSLMCGCDKVFDCMMQKCEVTK